MYCHVDDGNDTGNVELSLGIMYCHLGLGLGLGLVDDRNDTSKR